MESGRSRPARFRHCAGSEYWPIRLIKYLARFPHEYSTWLGWGPHHSQRG
ncbi:MAG: suppressor of fused domain protein [Enterocloster bolteae]